MQYFTHTKEITMKSTPYTRYDHKSMLLITVITHYKVVTIVCAILMIRCFMKLKQINLLIIKLTNEMTMTAFKQRTNL